jgi:hypothetical protein
VSDTKTPLLDQIKTETNEFIGVVDYVTSKYVTLFDVSSNNDPEITKLLILYKMYYSHLRFSVFKALFFPHFPMEAPIMINRKTIQETSKVLSIERPLIRRRPVKTESQNQTF